MSTINTFVDGSPSDVRTAADLLDKTLKAAAQNSQSLGMYVPTSVNAHWYGDSAESYKRVIQDAGDASEPIIDFASRGGEVLRSYAGQLERLQNAMADNLQRARNDGLSVAGDVIAAPIPPLNYEPESRDDPNWDIWKKYKNKLETYDEIAEDVGDRTGRFERWIGENLDPLAAEIPDDGGLLAVLSALQDEVDLPKEYLGIQGDLWDERAKELAKQAQELRDQAAADLRGLRSGHPGVRAAAEAANPRAMGWAADEVDEYAKRLGKVAKFVPGVGWLIDGKSVIDSLEGDGSPSEEVVGIAGGIVGGAATAGGIALAGVTAPAWVPVAVVAGAAVVVGMGAKWAYDSWVPQDVRESIDAGMRDAWDATKDFAEDAWENTGDFIGDSAHNVKKWFGDIF